MTLSCMSVCVCPADHARHDAPITPSKDCAGLHTDNWRCLLLLYMQCDVGGSPFSSLGYQKFQVGHQVGLDHSSDNLSCSSEQRDSKAMSKWSAKALILMRIFLGIHWGYGSIFDGSGSAHAVGEKSPATFPHGCTLPAMRVVNAPSPMPAGAEGA